MQIKIEVFYKLIISTPNKKFEYLCNICRKCVGDEVDFLHLDKHGSFLQVDIIILGVHSQLCLKYIKLQVCNIFAISQGKREG